RRTRPLTLVGPPGTATRLADTMECLFPGSPTAPRRAAVEVTELAPPPAGRAAARRIGITRSAVPAHAARIGQGSGTGSVLPQARPARHHGHMARYADYC